MFALYYIYFGLLFTAGCWRSICAQSNFSMGGTSNAYDCNWTLICLGGAHVYAGDSNGNFTGSLSLVPEDVSLEYQSGIAYYKQPVRMRDSSTRKSTSFNTSFAFAEVNLGLWDQIRGPLIGDGIAFVISADNKTLGAAGRNLGIFSMDGSTSFKSIVVEFDNTHNKAHPYNDIGGNHVSFDFMNVTAVAVRNATDVGVYFWLPGMKYAWVEYSTETKLLEVRISNTSFRPVSPFLSYPVDLFDVVEEYMWVGFSGSTGRKVPKLYSNYYIVDWSFESYGIPPYGPTTTPAKAQSKVGIRVGLSVGVPVLAVASAGILMLYFWRRRGPRMGCLTKPWQPPNQSDSKDSMLQLVGMVEAHRFSYEQLSVATGHFSDKSKLGQGGSGSVYRGVLPASGVPVAVKKINGESRQGEKLFTAEVLTISQLRHRNLIKLLGWCKEKDRYVIVYELMPNGSLDHVLFGLREEHTVLSWPQRFNILRGTAAALEYLHQGWEKQVIHRDIKSSNIMLDDKWNAKLGDFGLARLVDHERTPATTHVAGTYGYIAPEVFSTGKFTERTDVFAFGAVALEIACGRKCVSIQMPEDEVVLVDWVWQRLSEKDLFSVVDRRLGDYDAHWMEVVLLIGLLCSHPDPLARPAMRHVVQVLAGDIAVPSVPMSKPRPTAVFMARSYSKTVSTCEILHGSDPSTSLNFTCKFRIRILDVGLITVVNDLIHWRIQRRHSVNNSGFRFCKIE